MEEVDLRLKLRVFSGPFGVFSGPLRSRVNTVINFGTVLLAHLNGLYSIV
ncbi:hypothetical protein SLEP1_g26779 [Rubroshorea leprosula]|uniref:Uncharacterized protein n=1 Tax=Rubroshorea leprosula TaxID=152421 RepID=A0AAV5JN10_9ROSI|nr:hypothetical protein SLEP1_g26779 [Rubroshorea leprosula]